MVIRPCPICRKPVSWETSPWRPFCSKRCQTRDLGAWAAGDYTLPADPAEASDDEAWSQDGPPAQNGPRP